MTPMTTPVPSEPRKGLSRVLRVAWKGFVALSVLWTLTSLTAIIGGAVGLYHIIF
jgi:hypothetical protein